MLFALEGNPAEKGTPGILGIWANLHLVVPNPSIHLGLVVQAVISHILWRLR